MVANSDLVVRSIPQGQLCGVQRTSIYDATYYSFENIPYAQPPLGELRFKAPQPAVAWQGIRDCSSCADKPVQRNVMTGQLEGNEDCLYLNVYAKKLTSDKPLPVMVWIYGGGFYMGEATRELYSPDYFMSQSQEPIVLVTFNYRLCSLGFLSLSDPALEVPGNAGLKDQVLALKWVKENIAHFNGDTNNITVFGESAGGASTHYMTLTKQTRGLFHKAIPMSGCALNNWANLPQTDLAFRLAKQYGYAGENVDRDVLAHLRKLEPHQLVKHNLLNNTEKRNGVLFPFGPTVEPYVGEDCVIPEAPLEMLRNAWSNEIPIMLGGTSFEGLLMYPRLKMSPGSTQSLCTDVERVLPIEVCAAHSADERKVLASKLLHSHFDGAQPSEELKLKYLDLLSYKVFWHGFHRTALARVANARAPTYLYRFDFDSPDFNHHRIKFCGTDVTNGVAHADDLSYLFFHKDARHLTSDSAEYKTIERMVGMWCAFAKSSDPNCAAIEPVVWQPLQPNEPQRALNISYELEFLPVLPEATKLAVWDTLYASKDLF